MKKSLFLSLLLTLLLLAPLVSEAEGYRAVIANPSAADRLNLRKKPDAASTSLGRFYSGTPITVVREEDEWAYVTLGDLQGYVMKDYLMKENRNYGAPGSFYTAETVGSIALRESAKNSSDQLAKINGKVEVLGDIGDDWRYVYAISAGKYGYVRTAQLKNPKIDIPLAYLQGSPAIYSDKALKKSIAIYYSGTPVRVIDMSRASGWAKIEIYGLPYSSDFQEKALEGYIALANLRVFCQPWQVNPYYQTCRALSDFNFTSIYDGQRITVPKDAYVSVIGETEKEYHIVYGQADSASYSTGLVAKTKLHNITRRAGLTGPGRMGYAYLLQETDPEGYAMGIATYETPGGREDERVYRPLAEVIGDENGYLQLRNPDDRNFFVPNTQAKVITAEQLQVNSVRIELPREWTAAQDDEGLWGFCVDEGRSARLTLTDKATNKHEVYDVRAGEEEVLYTVYIPAGTQISLTGTGYLLANLAHSINDQIRWHDFSEDEIFFSGSGRFFCDENIPDLGTWFDYEIRPMPGAEDSYCVLSNLFTEAGEEIRIEFDQETPFFRTNRWDLCPGAFLELHNCIVTLYYGNG